MVAPATSVNYGFAYDPNAAQAQGQQQQRGSAYNYGSSTGVFNPAAGIMASGGNQSMAQQAQAAPPKEDKPGFFDKLGSVVKGVASIPGKIVGGVVNTVKAAVTDPGKFFSDPKNLLMIAGTIACFIPGVNAIAIPAMAAYGIYQGGKMAVQGGMQAVQGWKNDDLQMIEDGVANAGTGAVVAGASVVGARANLVSKGITPKGTGFMQSSKLAGQNAMKLGGDIKAAWSGGTNGAVSSKLLAADSGVTNTSVAVTHTGARGVADLAKGYYQAPTNSATLANGVAAGKEKIQTLRGSGEISSASMSSATTKALEARINYISSSKNPAQFSAELDSLTSEIARRSLSTEELLFKANNTTFKSPVELSSVQAELTRRGTITGSKGNYTLETSTAPTGNSLVSNASTKANQLRGVYDPANLSQVTTKNLTTRMNEISSLKNPTNSVMGEYYAIEAELAGRGATISGTNGALKVKGGTSPTLANNLRTAGGETAGKAADWLSNNNFYHFGNRVTEANRGGLPFANNFDKFSVGTNGIVANGVIANGQVNPFEQMMAHAEEQYMQQTGGGTSAAAEQQAYAAMESMGYTF